MIKIALVVFIVSFFAGCSFQIGIEYTGKSAKNDNHFTPAKTPIKPDIRY